MEGEELPIERKQIILKRLQRDGKVLAADLSAEFGVSEDTVRRDLRDLASTGALLRVHGGALPRSPSSAPFAQREKAISEATVSVAKRAARLVRDGQVVFLDGGTTMLEVARHLDHGLRATVITISPKTALALCDHERIDVILIGGSLDRNSMTSCGAAALDMIRSLRADVCLLGICSLHPEVGITDIGYEESILKKAMIEQSGEVTGVVTADKLGTASPYVVAPIGRLARLVTETGIAPQILEPYRTAGIELID
jgi:DeoR/GlpR family transcriptional regulator of sugar metabolism